MGAPAGEEPAPRMSAIRLYLDEDAMRRSLVFGLRSRGVDVLTAAEAETINRRDEDQLEFAARSARVLYTKQP